MQTLRTIIWALTAAALALFASANLEHVPVRLLPGSEPIADVRLAFLIFIVAMISFLPPFLVYVASKWRARRTIEQQAQVISDLRTAPIATALPETAASDAAAGSAMTDSRPL